MARLAASRPWLLPALLSLAAHALLFAPLSLWRGGDGPPLARVLDTRVEVTLADPLPLPGPAAPGAAEKSEFLFTPTLEHVPDPPAAGAPARSSLTPTLQSSGPPLAPGSTAGAGRAGRGNPQGGNGLLAVTGPARKVVYVLDRSVSMGLGDALVVARREVLASVQRLPADATFQVIAYNEKAEPLWPGVPTGWLPLEPAILEQLAHFLDTLPAAGDSRHVLALRRALALQPDLLFLVTDAAELTLDEVQLITRLNQGRAVIHTVELTGRLPRPEGPLGQLASANGGTYRCAVPRP